MQKPLTLELAIPLQSDLPGDEPDETAVAASDESKAVTTAEALGIAREPSLWRQLSTRE